MNTFTSVLAVEGISLDAKLNKNIIQNICIAMKLKLSIHKNLNKVRMMWYCLKAKIAQADTAVGFSQGSMNVDLPKVELLYPTVESGIDLAKSIVQPMLIKNQSESGDTPKLVVHRQSLAAFTTAKAPPPLTITDSY